MDSVARPGPNQDHPQVPDIPRIGIHRPKPASWSSPGHRNTRRQSVVVRWLEEDFRRGSLPQLSLGPVPATSLLAQSSTDLEGKPTAAEDNTQFLSGFKLVALASVLTLTGFILFLDVSILSSAIPGITTEFHSLADSGWYAGVYQFLMAALGPLSGKIYAKFSAKWTFIAFVTLFEIGSLVCAVAPSSAVLIGGRVIAGAGGSGIFNGVLTIITAAVVRENRPVLIGIIVGISQLGVVVGPLLGGIFTEYLSWRWCFYINLCVGGPCTAFLVLSRIPELPRGNGMASPSFIGALRNFAQDFDSVGFALFVPSVVMFILALQLGGNQYAWDSPTIWGLFDGAFLGAFFFILWERYRGKRALMPTHIIGQRVVVASMLHHACIESTITVSVYYLPYYFQTVLNKSPVIGGIDLFPSIASQIVFSMIAGVYVKKVGYVLPFALWGDAMTSIGGGLLSTLSPTSSTLKWAGYQLIAGTGRGAAFILGMAAVQSLVQDAQIPEAMAMLMFAQYLGGAIMTVLAQTIYNETLKANIATYAPSVPPTAAIAAGGVGSAVRALLPPGSPELPGLLLAYSKATGATQLFTAGLAGAAFVFAWGTGWRDLRKSPPGSDDAGQPGDQPYRGKERVDTS